MKVRIMWIPNAVGGPSVAISPVPPETKNGINYFSAKTGSFGCTPNNGYHDIFDYLYVTYIETGFEDRDVQEIEL